MTISFKQSGACSLKGYWPITGQASYVANNRHHQEQPLPGSQYHEPCRQPALTLGSIIKMLIRAVFVVLLAGFVVPVHAQSFKNGQQMTVGITLHPYYSFVSNIVGDKAQVLPLISAGNNPHNYSPLPEDMRRAQTLDVLVINGIGHDEWALEIMAAVDAEIPMIHANDSVALMPVSGQGDQSVNSHTFISINTAIQQIYEIARRLGELDPPNAAEYRSNSRSYANRLRRLKAEFAAEIASLDSSQFRAATMHGAYGYLMQEFGLSISAVIEPRHGVEPTARQLAQTISEIQSAGVNVMFGERYFADRLAATIREETGVSVFAFSHISDGEYTPHLFEEEMRRNLETLRAAILTTVPQ
jgi:zinc transport system substrate-binding protein